MHGPGALDGVNPDVGTAVERYHAVAKIFAASLQQSDEETHFVGIVTPGFENMMAHSPEVPRTVRAIVVSIYDHGSMIGRNQHEWQRPLDTRHSKLP
jgi:hypothetical protein